MSENRVIPMLEVTTADFCVAVQLDLCGYDSTKYLRMIIADVLGEGVELSSVSFEPVREGRIPFSVDDKLKGSAILYLTRGL